MHKIIDVYYNKRHWLQHVNPWINGRDWLQYCDNGINDKTWIGKMMVLKNP